MCKSAPPPLLSRPRGVMYARTGRRRNVVYRLGLRIKSGSVDARREKSESARARREIYIGAIYENGGGCGVGDALRQVMAPD